MDCFEKVYSIEKENKEDVIEGEIGDKGELFVVVLPLWGRNRACLNANEKHPVKEENY